MKKIIALFSILALILPSVYSITIGSGITPDIRTENFKPMIWLCDSRAVYDDNTEPGRLSTQGLLERVNNYVFEGEQIYWQVLVMDKNGIEKVKDVFVSIGPYKSARKWVTYYYYDSYCMDDCQSDYDACYDACYNGYDPYCLDLCLPTCSPTDDLCIAQCYDDCYLGTILDPQCVDDCNNDKTSCEAGCRRTGRRLDHNNIEANCRKSSGPPRIPPSCNARILEEKLSTYNPSTMSYYDCLLTVETPLSMYGEYFVTLEVEDLDGLYNYASEVEYWFLNPEIALSIRGDLVFEDVRPGTSSYSDTLLVENDADQGSGVLLDMFISGTDFYDSSSSGAKCPVTNQLALTNFAYFATKGAYSTRTDGRNDIEGYVPIGYANGFNAPNPFYNAYEIIQSAPMSGPYYEPNILSPGAEMALTFRLNLPEPCNGDFDTGRLDFWGEAI